MSEVKKKNTVIIVSMANTNSDNCIHCAIENNYDLTY